MEMEKEYMKEAVNLALKGLGHVNPNPMVGAVIVKNGEIIGSGYHEKYGELHAERNALKSCSSSPEGAAMYVTLEPCCHYGKTPPCTDAIIESGISKVVIGSSDPNPLVAGKGIEILRRNGIEVEDGLLKQECDEINEVFFHFINRRAPFVLMKFAMSLDGKIAANSGNSMWISNEKSRENVHKYRNYLSAIMVGINTVLKDDPKLTCRLPNSRNPIRIVCDSKLQIPINSYIVKTSDNIKTYIATVSDDSKKKAELEKYGVVIIETKADNNGRIDLNDLMNNLYNLKIDSILLEGGSTLNYSALKSGIVSRIHAYIAPLILGGNGQNPVGGNGVEFPSQGFKLKKRNMHLFGDDYLLEYDIDTAKE